MVYIVHIVTFIPPQP